MLRELRVSEMRYRAVLEVLDGRDQHGCSPLRGVAPEGARVVGRWVDQRGSIRLAGFGYRVPIVLAGEPVEAVVADNLVQI